MSVDTHAVITNSNIVEIKKFIVSAYGGKSTLNVIDKKAPHDASITLPKAFHTEDERYLRISENVWGKELVSGNLYSNIGDTYIVMGAHGIGPKILKFITSYFGGYYSATDGNGGPEYIKLKRDNRECIRSYFESVEGTTNEVQ
jgi:hypothetical protein